MSEVRIQGCDGCLTLLLVVAAIIWISVRTFNGCVYGGRQVEAVVRMQNGSVTNIVVERRDVRILRTGIVEIRTPDGRILSTGRDNVALYERTEP